jgi:phosphoribosylglycinamide formyltransferase-1
MHVGVITYQVGHLKTWQIMRKMMTKGYRVTLYAFPFKLHSRPGTERYKDRPDQLINFDVVSFCQRYGIGYVAVDSWNDEFAHCIGEPGTRDCPEVYLHCIAKIVPASFIEGRAILNCHPGLLPQNRGVDAFKWSIVNKWPIGVALHAIDPAIDCGMILRRMRIPVFPTDTLAAVCTRAYEFEIDLLANFEHHLPNLSKSWAVGDDHPCSHKRIPAETDENLEQIFEQNREELCRLSVDPSAQPHPSDGFTGA